MTWKEFKKLVESKGIKNNFVIKYIDISAPGMHPELEVVCVGKAFYIEN